MIFLLSERLGIPKKILEWVKGHLYLLDSLDDMMKNYKPNFKYKILFTGNGSVEYKN